MQDKNKTKNIAIWEQNFVITHYFVDPDGNTSIHGLAFFLQEVAHNHATTRSLGFDDLIKDNKAWVLTRQAIKIYKIPVIGEQVTVESWVQDTTSSFSIRDFHIYNSHREVIGLARTSWMMLDVIHRKPVKIPDEVLALIPKTPGKLKEDIQLEKLPRVEFDKVGSGFDVKYSDLDMNHHVNNITYVRWVSDDFEQEFRKKYRLETLEMNYLSEALYGDKLIANTIPVNGRNCYLTMIRREKDNREILNARTFWIDKSR